MKKFLLLFLLALFVSGLCFAQVFVGGSVGFEFSSTGNNTGLSSDTTEIGFFISPALGVSIFEIDVGLNVSYGISSGSGNDGKASTLGFGISAFAPLIWVDFFSLKAGLSLEYATVTLESEYMGYVQKQKMSALGIGLSPRFMFRLGERLALYADIGSLQYSHGWSDEILGYKLTTNSFGLSVNTGSAFGFLYYI